jgi:hypothetical protein
MSDTKTTNTTKKTTTTKRSQIAATKRSIARNVNRTTTRSTKKNAKKNNNRKEKTSIKKNNNKNIEQGNKNVVPETTTTNTDPDNNKKKKKKLRIPECSDDESSLHNGIDYTKEENYALIIFIGHQEVQIKRKGKQIQLLTQWKGWRDIKLITMEPLVNMIQDWSNEVKQYCGKSKEMP